MEYVVCKRDLSICKLDSEKKYYLDITNSSLGFSIEDVEKYPYAFRLALTLEEANQKVKLLKFEEKYGHKEKHYYDFACPKCNYKFATDEYIDHNDGAYTSAPIDDYVINISCICGCKFSATVKVKIEFIIKEEN